MAGCGVSLHRCSTSLPELPVLPLESVVVAQKTMAQWVATFKFAQLSQDAIEQPLSIVRLTLVSPMSSQEVTGDDVRRVLQGAGFLPPAVKVALYYKDDEDDFVTLPSLKDVWPSCCISNGVLKAWFICVPEPPGTTLPAPVCACPGPHVHQPDKKKMLTLDHDGFKGYSLLAAAGDGCASCVEHWLEKGVDPNFESSSQGYTAMDWILWTEKKSCDSAASAKQVKEMLMAAGGRANKM